MTIFIPLLFLITGFTTNLKLVDNLSYCFVIMARLFFPLQFVLASLAVEKRFACLNQHLELLISQQSLNKFSLNCFQASKYSKSFHKLCDGIDTINETFTFQLILIFATVTVRHFWKTKFKTVKLHFLGCKHFFVIRNCTRTFASDWLEIYLSRHVWCWNFVSFLYQNINSLCWQLHYKRSTTNNSNYEQNIQRVNFQWSSKNQLQLLHDTSSIAEP